METVPCTKHTLATMVANFPKPKMRDTPKTCPGQFGMVGNPPHHTVAAVTELHHVQRLQRCTQSWGEDPRITGSSYTSTRVAVAACYSSRAPPWAVACSNFDYDYDYGRPGMVVNCTLKTDSLG